MKKIPRDIIILHVFQKLWLDDVLLLRYGARETDGQTNGRTDGKSDTEVAASPKNSVCRTPYLRNHHMIAV